MNKKIANSVFCFLGLLALAACGPGTATSGQRGAQSTDRGPVLFAEVLPGTHPHEGQPRVPAPRRPGGELIQHGWGLLHHQPPANDPAAAFGNYDVVYTQFEQDEFDAYNAPHLLPGFRPYAIGRFWPAVDQAGQPLADWYQIAPDARGRDGFDMYIGWTNTIFLHGSQLRRLPPQTPVSVRPATTPRDKLMVLVADLYPQLFLFEGDQIVLSTPAVIGGNYAHTTTPMGGHRISELHPSITMAGHPGVGFVSYLDIGAGGGYSRSNGYALHNSPWWDWTSLPYGAPPAQGEDLHCDPQTPCRDGLRCLYGSCRYLSPYGAILQNTAAGLVGSGYGSHGCINLPDERFLTPTVDGRQVSVAELIFRWIRTNVTRQQPEQYWKTPNAHYEQDEAYRAGESTVRMLAVRDLDYLNTERFVAPHGQESFEGYRVAIAEARRQGWVIPQLTTEQGQVLPE